MLLAVLAACARQPRIPLASGRYEFQHRYAEHPSIRSIPVTVVIDGNRIEVINEQTSSHLPKGRLDQGMLLWHAASGQWIIAQFEEEKDLAEVGGCSGGPDVIDLVDWIYWTC